MGETVTASGSASTSRDAPIDVLVVDDSAVIRGVISRGIASDPAIRIVGAASDGRSALTMVQALSPHVVLLDVEMPVMNGIEALPQILAARPGTAVIMASALTRRHASMSLRALQLGAADYVPKPDAQGGTIALNAFFDELRAKIKAHGRRRGAVAAPMAPVRDAHAPVSRVPARLLAFAPDVVAIGASTGGPPALLKIFARAKGAINKPVFITQHMPATFTAMLAEQLSQVSGAEAIEGVDGVTVKPGTIYVAPGGKHLLAERTTRGVIVRLSDAPPENFCKPAVDPMFRSLARAYGRGVLAAVLTGMGRDGAEGALAIAEAGGQFVVQDEASSVVYGMPGAAFRTGRSAWQASLDDTADFLSVAMRGVR